MGFEAHCRAERCGQGLDDSDAQWQREPSSHLRLDFIYGYQGSSCWDQRLFGPGPGCCVLPARQLPVGQAAAR